MKMKLLACIDSWLEKRKEELANADRIRTYNDIAILLWYKVLYDDVLSYKRKKMDEQQEPFRIFQWGNYNYIYGKVKALVSQTDTDKFIKTAEAELRDRGYGDFSVKVYPDAIVVTQKRK